MALTEHDTAASPDPPRDPVLDRAYAAGASEEPPARLDASILAAARREVGARPRGMDSRLRTWRAPMALAAVLVLSVSVVLLLREEGADRLDQTVSGMAPPAADSARPPAPAAPSAKLESAPDAALSADVAPQVRSAPAPRPRAVEEDRRKDQPSPGLTQDAPPAAEAPRPAPRPFAMPSATPAEPRRAAPEAPPPETSSLAKEGQPGSAVAVRERAATAERELQAQRAPAPPPAATAPDAAVGGLARPQAGARQAPPESANRMEQKLRDDAAAGGPRPVWQGFERQPPEKWLERVEELRRSGRNEEAREMLAEFRKRFPQHPVPPALDR